MVHTSKQRKCPQYKNFQTDAKSPIAGFAKPRRAKKEHANARATRPNKRFYEYKENSISTKFYHSNIIIETFSNKYLDSFLSSQKSRKETVNNPKENA